MKKVIFTLLGLVLLVTGIFFVMGLFDSKPPTPTITVGEKQLEVARGSYCWNGLLNAICADTISPPMLIEHHGMKPVFVSPGSELKIKFKKEPIENTLGVNRWRSNSTVDKVALSNHILKVPYEKGVYIYDVHASWEEGSSSYAFVIEVK